MEMRSTPASWFPSDPRVRAPWARSRTSSKKGIATTQISLVRGHTVAMAPPRALWVPFELGRPLGVPGDPAFQIRILGAALALLETESGPVLLDYAEEVPQRVERDGVIEGWVCPVMLPPVDVPGAGTRDRAAALAEEISLLVPWYDLACEARGRTTVGLSGLAIEDAGSFLAGCLNAVPLETPVAGHPVAMAIKFAYEDLKAFYAEAATARPGAPGGDGFMDWFWGETRAGRLLLDLKAQLLKSEDELIRHMATGSIVPVSQRHREA